MSTSLATAADLSGKVSPQGLRRADNILVYLTKTPEFSRPPQNEFVMDQNDLTFLPHVHAIGNDMPRFKGEPEDFTVCYFQEGVYQGFFKKSPTIVGNYLADIFAGNEDINAFVLSN